MHILRINISANKYVFKIKRLHGETTTNLNSHENRYTILCYTMHILTINISANKYVFKIKRLHSETTKNLNSHIL
jgi:hypothetical protein